MMVVTMNAQSIVGTWQANIPAAEFGLLLVFEEDSQASIVIVGDIKESDMSAKMLMGVPGTYKKEGNILSLNMKKEEAEIDFAELKLSGELEGKEEMVKGLSRVQWTEKRKKSSLTLTSTRQQSRRSLPTLWNWLWKARNNLSCSTEYRSKSPLGIHITNQ